jgi:hypothetical protein
MADKEVFDFDQVKMPNISPNLIKYGVIGIFVLIFIFSSSGGSRRNSAIRQIFAYC